MSTVDVRKVAQLARLAISDEEIIDLEKKVADIITLVDELQKVSATLPDEPVIPAHRTVMREDGDAHDEGKYTEAILEVAPSSREGRIAVAQVIKR